MFFDGWIQRGELFPPAVDDVEAQVLQLRVVELVDLVNLLQADDACITLLNLLDNARPAELKVADLR